MRSVGHEAALLLESRFNALQHAVNRHHQLAHLIVRRRHRDAAAEIRNLDLPGCLDDGAQGVQRLPAHIIASDERQQNAQSIGQQEAVAQQVQKIPLRRDHAQEVKLVRLSLPLDGEGLIIHVKFIEKNYLQRLAGPEGRGFHNVLLHLVHRRIMGLAVKDAHPVAVFNAQDHPRRQRTVPIQLKRELRRHHPVRIQLPPGPLLP